MITIIFESHGTTTDNEKHLASGNADVELSELGIQQSKEMSQRYVNDHFDAIFCSNLQRSYKSAEIAFGDKFPIVKDARLNECDYGDLTQHPSKEVDLEKPKRITVPFPNGESYIEKLEIIKERSEAAQIKFLGACRPRRLRRDEMRPNYFQYTQLRFGEKQSLPYNILAAPYRDGLGGE